MKTCTARRMMTVALITALLLPSRFAGAVPPRAAPADFADFWQQALMMSRTEPLLPRISNGELHFRGANGQAVTAACHIPKTSSVKTPVVYITDRSGTDSLHLPADRASLVLDARLLLQAPAGLPDTDRHPLRHAILNTVRAVELFIHLVGDPAQRTGLAGEGYGGGLAMAAAALLPENTAWLAVYQPLPGYFVRADGRETDARARAALLHHTDRRYGKWEDDMVAAGAYFETVHFAALVKAPSLVGAAERDATTPLYTVEAVFASLQGQKEAFCWEGPAYTQNRALREWDRLWPEWADTVAAAVPSAEDTAPQAQAVRRY